MLPPGGRGGGAGHARSPTSVTLSRTLVLRCRSRAWSKASANSVASCNGGTRGTRLAGCSVHTWRCCPARRRRCPPHTHTQPNMQAGQHPYLVFRGHSLELSCRHEAPQALQHTRDLLPAVLDVPVEVEATNLQGCRQVRNEANKERGARPWTAATALAEGAHDAPGGPQTGSCASGRTPICLT